jgi:hypothetical protein
MPAASFFEPLSADRFRATEHTVGPWDPDAQHGGPPSALLARAVENVGSWPGTVTRISLDILGPVPVGELTARARVLRPGRSVELVEAELEAGDRTVLRATAWRIKGAALDLPPLPVADDVPPGPEHGTPGWWEGSGYLRAMEWSRIRGGEEPGPGTIWGRMRYPLLPDEEPTGLQRVLTLADSGSGVSRLLESQEWIFINPELTVHLAAVPTGEWICLDGVSRIDRTGFGLATTRIYDRSGLVGHGAQSLYVTPR